MKIQLSKIDIQKSVQVRVAIHGETVERYAEHLQKSGAVPLPPIVVFGPDSRGMYFLSEGWHRYEAHKKAKRDGILATVKEGGWKEALENALGSNDKHGLPRNNKDKRRVVELTFMHWPNLSHQMVADKCAVSKAFVESVRKVAQPSYGRMVDESPTTQSQGLTESDPPVREVLGKDGKLRKISTRPPTRRPSENPPEDDPDVGSDEPEKSQTPEPAADALPVDERGKTVPPHLVALWRDRDILRGMVRTIREIRADAEEAIADSRPLFVGRGQGGPPINAQGLIASLMRTEEELKNGIPYTVCGACNGGGCRGCSGNGLATRTQFERLAPEFRT